MKRFFALGTFCMLVLATGQSVADEAIKNRVAADTLEKFQAVAADIRKDMSAGGRYEYITPDNKAKVESDLTAMTEMLQKGSANTLSEPEKVKLFNTQEHLNGVLTHSDGSRLVCERTAPVGTTIPKTTCQTVADIERNRRAGQNSIKQAGVAGSTCVKFCRSN
jgi:hypothetical protein